jgi:hypothetical protein
MKNVTAIIILFAVFTAFACGDNSAEKNISKETPKAAALEINDTKPANTIVEKDAIEPQMTTDVKEETAIIKEQVTKKVEKAKNVAASEKNVAKAEKQPTQTDNAASVKQPTEPKTKPVAAPIQEKTETPEPPKEEKPKMVVPNHAAWNTLLQKNVSASGKVNYKGFKAQKAALQSYLDDLSANPPASDWGRKETMAYWINAYNAYTVKLIIDNYPLSSITNLEGGKPWDKKWIKLGSKTYSLNNIENDILRPKYKDARIHFAVNCAAQSCPPILNKAWTAANLNGNFDKQAKAFINNPKFNKISADAIEISKIFEWYAGDFDDIITYLNKYSTTKINPGAKVSYMEYDWALNE